MNQDPIEDLSQAPDNSCWHCHFLHEDATTIALEFRKPESTYAQDAQPRAQTRELLRTYRNGKIDPGFGCARAIWRAQRMADDKQNGFQDLIEELIRDRGETCCFFKLSPGMRIRTAVELEKRQADRREAERDRRQVREEATKDRQQAREEAKKDRKVSYLIAFATLVAACTSAVLALRGGCEPPTATVQQHQPAPAVQETYVPPETTRR
ncbi:MAG: hypothetical protein R6V05_04680 [Candidatus Brocadiia bacterium]